MININEWHCGHILSRKESGTRKPENLRPVCRDCNLNMGTTHMDEYILIKNMPGKKNIDENDPFIQFFRQAANLVAITNERLNRLQEQRVLTMTEVKKYRTEITSSKRSLSARVSVMINLAQYEQRIPALLEAFEESKRAMGDK